MNFTEVYKMKKLVTLMMMLVMMFSFTLTANAEISPSGKPVTDAGTSDSTSPKTGESDIVLYGLGAVATVLASGAVVIRRKVTA